MSDTPLREIPRELQKFETRDLVAELARRMGMAVLGRPERFCETCAQFKQRPSERSKANPCQRGHRMDFWMPEHPNDDEYGYYRVGCDDREERDG
jgi:hypothetical protein